MAGPLSGSVSPRRRFAFAALVAAVLALHGGMADVLREHLAEWRSVAAMPPRIEVAYVRELEPAAPPAVVAPPAAPPAPPRPVKTPAAPASAPPLPPAAEPPPPEPLPETSRETKVAAVPPEPVASMPEIQPAPEAPASAASAAEPFEWPASTRLSYKLTGSVRGEVHGDAQVEWLREGSRYQVHLDVTVGLPIAPLMSRRMSSEGELTAQGLAPRRYDEDTKVVFNDRRRLTMRFEPEGIVMPGGARQPRWEGVQDTASQFVQLSWLFSTRPQLLRIGSTIDFALALPRSVDRWVYDVVAEEPVATHFGAVNAFHLKPRRVSRPGGDLVAEIWFAPTLRYLPARIRIEQDPATFIDLVLSRKPEIAEK